MLFIKFKIFNKKKAINNICQIKYSMHINVALNG